jgi:acyl transferase domain-containing protein
MGAEAMKVFPSFLETIQSLDCVLQSLDPPPPWKIEDVLLDPVEASRLNDAEISQPLCTAIQIALVNLMAKWGILPTVTVGHSSGEIAAAYAAGLISAGEAITAAFYRGYTVKYNAVSGTMLAAGLGVEDISKYLRDAGDVVVSCVNSPRSITLSGSVASIHEVKARLDADGVFARELNTGKAYHSPQMDAVAPEYEQLYTAAISRFNNGAFNRRCPRARMISSVTGQEIHEDSLSITYWCDNLRGQVKFDQAVTTILESDGLEKVKCAIEVGPHSALAGPFKQIWQSLAIDNFHYIPTLVRNTDSAIQLFKMAGELFLLGSSVDIGLVNAVEDTNAANSTPELLVDLPPYQWNYKKIYWAEPSISKEQRRKSFLRHDLLGSRIVGLSERVWVNRLRHKDIPWLVDHSLGGSAVFPAAGYLSMAIEALRQVLEVQNREYRGMRFRDTSFKLAMVIPETGDGLEVQLRLQPVTKSSNGTEPAFWYSFMVESFTDGRWTTHSEGMIAANSTLRTATSANEPPASLDKVTQPTLSKRWYSSFSRVGFNYGPSFRGLNNIRASKGFNEAIADVDLSTESGLMTGESRYILHPSAIDACLQLMIVSINEGLYKSMQFGSVPINIEEISLWFPGTDIEFKGKAVAWSEVFGRYANNNAQLKGESGQIILDIRGLRSVTYEAAVPQQTDIVTATPRPYMGVVWKPDIARLKSGQLCQTFGHITTTATGLELIIKLLDLANHKMPLKNILLLGQHSAAFVKALLDIVPLTASCTICSGNLEQVRELETMASNDNRVSVKIVSSFSLPESAQSIPVSQDVVVVGKDLSELATDEMLLLTKTLRNDRGHIIFHTENRLGNNFEKALSTHYYPSHKLRFDLLESTVFLSCPEETHSKDGIIHEDVTVISLGEQSTLMTATNQFLEHQWHLETKELSAFDVSADKILIVDDIKGTFLSSLNRSSFESLKQVLCSGIPIVWLTAGVNEGKRIGGSLAVGLIRAILAEQASAKIAILDVDVGEDAVNVMNAIASTICELGKGNSDAEAEVWLHNKSIHVSRLVSNNRLNDLLPESSKSTNTLLTTGRALEGTVVGGELVFDELSQLGQTQLADNDIEVQVFGSEINSADIQSQNQRARVIVGKIVATGKNLNNSLLGQHIMTYTHKAFSTLVRVSYFDTRLIKLCKDDVIAVLPSLCCVWNAVVNSAKVQRGQHILLLPAPTSFVKAFVSLSKTVGYTYTLMVESLEDEENYFEMGIPHAEIIRISAANVPLILTELIGNKGLASVISHEFSSLGQEVWRFVPARTIFVLLDGNIQEPPDILPFTKGATFLSTSVDMLYRQDRNALGGILEGAISHLKDHHESLEKGIDKCSIGSLSKVGSGATILTNTNDAAVTYQYGQDFIKAC